MDDIQNGYAGWKLPPRRMCGGGALRYSLKQKFVSKRFIVVENALQDFTLLVLRHYPEMFERESGLGIFLRLKLPLPDTGESFQYPRRAPEIT